MGNILSGVKIDGFFPYSELNKLHTVCKYICDKCTHKINPLLSQYLKSNLTLCFSKMFALNIRINVMKQCSWSSALRDEKVLHNSFMTEVPVSYRNQSIALLCKSMDWFLEDRDLHHESVKKENGKKWFLILNV